jgi:hypothetical protein
MSAHYPALASSKERRYVGGHVKGGPIRRKWTCAGYVEPDSKRCQIAGDATRQCLVLCLTCAEGLAEARIMKKPAQPKAVRVLFLVGARGFEPPTTWTPSRYATRLRYAPKDRNYSRAFDRIVHTSIAFQASRSRAATRPARRRNRPSLACCFHYLHYPALPSQPAPPSAQRPRCPGHRAGCVRR